MSGPISSASRLVLDASTKTIAVGIFAPGKSTWDAFASTPGDALETIFHLTRDCLAKGELSLPQLGGIDFCAGPGSLLGLRLAAMAVQTWRTLPENRAWTLRQYHSLTYLAHARLAAGESDFTLLSPFRRDLFNVVSVCDGSVGALDLVAVEELSTLLAPRYWVPNGAVRVPSPDGTVEIDHDLAAFPRLAASVPAPTWLCAIEQPEVCVPQAPTFALWSADRHRKEKD